MSHYIKCSKCNTTIPVKSEYMILCPNCDKKLDNSFIEWLVKHPESNYTNYLSEACISDIAISGLKDQRRISRKIVASNRLSRILIASVIAIVTMALAAVGYYLYKGNQKDRSINAIMNDTWKIQYYDDISASIKFPFELTEYATTMDSETLIDSTQIIIRHSSRAWSKDKILNVFATKLEFEPLFGVNREAATQEVLQAIVNNNEMRAFEFVPSDYAMGDGKKARMFSGSYLIKAEPHQFRAIMVFKNDTVWYFMISYPNALPEGALIADKFFKGIMV